MTLERLRVWEDLIIGEEQEETEATDYCWVLSVFRLA